MAGVNKVIIVGRLGSDPEVKAVSSGQNVARMSIATSDQWTDQSGQKQERTEWHRIVAWGRLADLCGKYLTKGRQVYLEGRLQTRSWEDAQGSKRYSTEVVATTVQFLGGGAERDTSAQPQAHQTQNNNFQDFGPAPSFDSDDEIPF